MQGALGLGFGLGLVFLADYAVMAADIIDADIEIVEVDEAKRYIRTFGTGKLSGRAEILAEGTLYDEAFERADTVLVQTPKRNAVCDKCSKKQRCVAVAEVAVPIFYKNKPVGAVGLAAQNPHQNKIIHDKATTERVLAMLAMFASRIMGSLDAVSDSGLSAAAQAQVAVEQAQEKEQENTEHVIRPLAAIEHEEILKAIEICGNTTQGKRLAAERLGIGVATLYRKLGEISRDG